MSRKESAFKDSVEYAHWKEMRMFHCLDSILMSFLQAVLPDCHHCSIQDIVILNTHHKESTEISSRRKPKMVEDINRWNTAPELPVVT